MIYNKKGEIAETAKNKLSIIQSYFDRLKMGKEWYDSAMVGLEDLPFQEWPEQHRAHISGYKHNQSVKDNSEYDRKYIKGRYFSAKEKDVIIDYLLDCLVNNEVFEYSTLGPNIYKNEHSISNVCVLTLALVRKRDN